MLKIRHIQMTYWSFTFLSPNHWFSYGKFLSIEKLSWYTYEESSEYNGSGNECCLLLTCFVPTSAGLLPSAVPVLLSAPLATEQTALRKITKWRHGALIFSLTVNCATLMIWTVQGLKSDHLHWVPLTRSSVTTSIRLQRADFLYNKIIDCSVKWVWLQSSTHL